MTKIVSLVDKESVDLAEIKRVIHAGFVELECVEGGLTYIRADAIDRVTDGGVVDGGEDDDDDYDAATVHYINAAGRMIEIEVVGTAREVVCDVARVVAAMEVAND
jgi:hypothetical protein